MTTDLVLQPSSCQLPGGRSYFLQVSTFLCQKPELVAIETALYRRGGRGGKNSLLHCLTWVLNVLYISARMCVSGRDLMNECVISRCWRRDAARLGCETEPKKKRESAVRSLFFLSAPRRELSTSLLSMPIMFVSMCSDACYQSSFLAFNV